MYQDALPRRALLGVQVGRTLDVERVIDGGAAAAARVAVGDRLVAVDGADLRDAGDLAARARTLRGGARVTFVVQRGADQVECAGAAPPYPVEPGVLLGHVASRGARLRTFFSIPESDGPKPAMLYMQSIRATSVESPLDAENPVCALARAFVAAGFVVMRVERSGVGDSEGPSPETTGLDAELGAYRSALEELRAFDEVDPARVVVVGHSFGGVLAPLVAKDVSGVCAFGASADRWHDTMLGTTRRQKDRTEEEMKHWEELFRLVHREALTPQRVFEMHPHLRSLRSRDCAGETMYGRHVSLFRELDAMDLEAAWRDVKARVLALHGEHDWICTLDQAKRIASLSKGRFEEISGSGHELDARVISAMVAFAQTVTEAQPPGKTQP
jgi:pimeloyl-ACP methyl ester carboxylesterase